ncbi:MULTISPECIES: hypothetical protein [unclassified Streptomyces]|uniref:hypothetical protein n=1 Tax=unclassified Streptomyces TaxID=2593676 RepID=UPI0037FF63F7
MIDSAEVVTFRCSGGMLTVCDDVLKLLPQLAAVEIGSVEECGSAVVVSAGSRAGPVVCTGCGHASRWERSRYVRHVAGEAVSGRPVRIDLSVRRLYCENPACSKVTFVEQIDELTVRYQRRAPGLQAIVVAVATALAGKADSRLLLHLHHTVSWASLLTCLLKIPDPPEPALRWSPWTTSRCAAPAVTPPSLRREFRETEGCSAGTRGSVGVLIGGGPVS